MQTEMDNNSQSTEKLNMESLSPSINCELDTKWKRSVSDASFFVHSSDQQGNKDGKQTVNVSEHSSVYWDLPEAVEASEAAEIQSKSISALLACQSGNTSANQGHQTGIKYGKTGAKPVEWLETTNKLLRTAREDDSDNSSQKYIHRVHFGETGHSARSNSLHPQHQRLKSRPMDQGFLNEENFCRRQSTPTSPFSSNRRSAGATLAVPYSITSQASPVKHTATAYRLHRPAASADKLLSTASYRNKYASVLGADDEDNHDGGSNDHLSVRRQRHSTVDKFSTGHRIRTSSVETDLCSTTNVTGWWRSTNDCEGLATRKRYGSNDTTGRQLKPSVSLSASHLFDRKAEDSENSVGAGSADIAETSSFGQLEVALLSQMDKICQLSASPLLTSFRERCEQGREVNPWTPGEQVEQEVVDGDVLELLDKEYEALNACTELLTMAQMSPNDHFNSRICALVKRRGLLDTLFARLAQPVFGQGKGDEKSDVVSCHQDGPCLGDVSRVKLDGDWDHPSATGVASSASTTSKLVTSTEQRMMVDSKSVDQRMIKEKQIVIRSAELLSQILSYQSIYDFSDKDEEDDEEEEENEPHHYVDEGAGIEADHRKPPVSVAVNEQPTVRVQLTLGSTPILCQDSADANLSVPVCQSQSDYPVTIVSPVYMDSGPEQPAETPETPAATSSIYQTVSPYLPDIMQRVWSYRSDTDMSQAYLAILKPLLNHTKAMSQSVVDLGGLQSLVYACRSNDSATLRPAVLCLANIALFGGADSQTEMLRENVIDWLFCLGCHPDEVVQYIACLVSVLLSTNTELLPYIDKVGTLKFVVPFVQSHRPLPFARDHLVDAFGPSNPMQATTVTTPAAGGVAVGREDNETGRPLPRNLTSLVSRCPGASLAWLLRLVPALSSQRLEARVLAAFHFTVETHLKAQVGQNELWNLFKHIGAIEPLHQLSCSLNPLESDFAIEALRLLGERKPHRLSPKVPSWTVDDVHHWLTGVGFGELSDEFLRLRMDGDFLLKLDESSLESDLDIHKRITRTRLLREITRVKVVADYSLQDHSNLAGWLRQATNFVLSRKSLLVPPPATGGEGYEGTVGSASVDPRQSGTTAPGSLRWHENGVGIDTDAAMACSDALLTSLVQYTYNLLAAGVTMSFLPQLTDAQLLNDCGIVSGVHRAQILSAVQAYMSAQSPSIQACLQTSFAVSPAVVEPNDVFISYRRSNGSHLASLLRVHLTLRGYKTFMDVERLGAGKFNESLLQWIQHSKHFLIVLTESALDRCKGDDGNQDWIHREILHALRNGVNIVPIISEFDWPSVSDLPEDIRPICEFHAVKWVHEYQDACVDRVEKFLRESSSSTFRENEKSSTKVHTSD